jgi:hypothetical protein
MKNDIQSNLYSQMITKIRSKIKREQRISVEDYKLRHFLFGKYFVK